MNDRPATGVPARLAARADTPGWGCGIPTVGMTGATCAPHHDLVFTRDRPPPGAVTRAGALGPPSSTVHARGAAAGVTTGCPPGGRAAYPVGQMGRYTTAADASAADAAAPAAKKPRAKKEPKTEA